MRRITGKERLHTVPYLRHSDTWVSTSRPRLLGASLLFLSALVLTLSGCRKFSGPVYPAGTPALHRAAAEGDLAQVKSKLGKNVDVRGPYGWTPLHYAAIYNAPEVARFLMSRRARVNALDQRGMTPLHWASRKGHFVMVELLLKQKADVAARNRFDMTALHEARTQKIAQLLIDRGADIHARDIDGMTPLHIAATRMVAQHLIKKGANIRAMAKDGRTPMTMPPTVRPRVK